MYTDRVDEKSMKIFKERKRNEEKRNEEIIKE